MALTQPAGNPHRAILLSGPRGIGKTVLLNEIEDSAQRAGWVIVRTFPTNTIETLVESTTQEAHRQPKPTLNSRFRELVSALPQGSGVVITIDEVQSYDLDALWEITSTVQDLLRDQLPVAIVADGLPEGIEKLLQHEGTTFLRRAARYDLTALGLEQSVQLLQDTAQLGKKEFDATAVMEAAKFTRGYPFHLQLLGSLLWNNALERDSKVIEVSDFHNVQEQALTQLGTLIHQPALRPVPWAERNYLEAMASLQADQEAVASSEIARALGKTTQQLAPLRQRLLDRNLIYAPRRGELNFVIPHLGHFLRRPQFAATDWD